MNAVNESHEDKTDGRGSSKRVRSRPDKFNAVRRSLILQESDVAKDGHQDAKRNYLRRYQDGVICGHYGGHAFEKSAKSAIVTGIRFARPPLQHRVGIGSVTLSVRPSVKKTLLMFLIKGMWRAAEIVRN
ncbi:hypothetical protein GWI33_017705 [Rhynchophorus ferrugineus]|uniref:Uncharacterized protein n=1 Tax=Rhynchophorus ferrugineus TaxID=354439 RepID=A0A834M8U0_RHYFE|nr:hypothetical protein GWI33_017705 [Rhynchophorus ferrugineus]